jgi:hypothetical protein
MHGETHPDNATMPDAVRGQLDRHVRPLAPKWYAFDSAKGSRQKRPPERKLVLVRLASAGEGLPEGIAVGYRKNAAGDKQSPYFVVPGLHTGTVLAWCDCLPEGFKWPNAELSGTARSADSA